MYYAREVISCCRNAQVSVPAIAAIDELFRADPIPEWLHGGADIGADVAELIDSGDEITAERVLLIEARRTRAAQAVIDGLIRRRDREAERMLHAALPELEAAALATMTADEGRQRDAEAELLKFGIRPYRISYDDRGENPAVELEQSDRLRSRCALAGSAVLAVYETWSTAAEGRRKVRGLMFRLERLRLIGGDSPALAAALRWPLTGEMQPTREEQAVADARRAGTTPTSSRGQRVKAALTKARPQRATAAG